MNRFLFMPRLKPELKRAQPLPAFHGVPMTKREPAEMPKVIALGLTPGDLPKLAGSLKRESCAAVRMVAS